MFKTNKIEVDKSVFLFITGELRFNKFSFIKIFRCQQLNLNSLPQFQDNIKETLG